MLKHQNHMRENYTFDLFTMWLRKVHSLMPITKDKTTATGHGRANYELDHPQSERMKYK